MRSEFLLLIPCTAPRFFFSPAFFILNVSIIVPLCARLLFFLPHSLFIYGLLHFQLPQVMKRKAAIFSWCSFIGLDYKYKTNPLSPNPNSFPFIRHFFLLSSLRRRCTAETSFLRYSVVIVVRCFA